MKRTLMLMLLAAAGRMGYACQDTAINWTIYLNYTDPTTGLVMTSQITGDGVQTDSAGNTIFADGPNVNARLNVCGTHPSYDATLGLGKTRSFNINLGVSLDNEYGKFPPTTTFYKENGLINVSDIMWCQNNGHPNGCTFYTRMASGFIAPGGDKYHLRMENPSSVPVTTWTVDPTGNCTYATSPVQVVFTPAALNASKKDTYVVTPVLQGINNSTGWTAPAATTGCPANSLPAGTWPAAVSALTNQTTGTNYNYGQYDTPFQFVIQVQ